MSLTRALAELFKAIREEAAANPEFALKLEAALSLYTPSKRRKAMIKAGRGATPAAERGVVPDFRDIAPPRPLPEPPPEVRMERPDALSTAIAPAAATEPAAAAEPSAAFAEPPALNPLSFFVREGEERLRLELQGAAYSRDTLVALLAEHNLDPAGQAADGDKSALVEQIIAQARRRVERDANLFEY